MFKTPGVYVQEVSTLPPSVAEVATAIPAFIGYTERGAAAAVEIAQVNTLLEYEQRFGKPRPTAFFFTIDGAVEPLASNVPDAQLWYALSLYFKNGGGRCYVVSVGNYQAVRSADRFLAGLTALEAEDEPTLIVLPEAAALPSREGFHEVCEAALAHCQKLGDRFAILDVKDGDEGQFRVGIGMQNLSYGAAYHPYLETTLAHAYEEEGVKLRAPAGETGDAGTTSATTLASLKERNTTLYNDLKKQLAGRRVTLPPSAAIAGVYARVDRERGVWKAPANVSLLSVIGPTTQVTYGQQELLNIDPTSGKSINVIRAFAGKGTLVWGARTLAGNDNEWRYVNVRRLFLMVEESAQKASAFAVFEANDVSTWLKVKGMLEAYLYGLWEQGALQGAKPEAAYYVHVGLGSTMTAQDVLEGRMIVELGLAAVRPAEFIVLRFSHKLPEA
ncbi:MAG: phage tail sheath subtilisin-like domain-containing protein [Kofleriaceae bacterium]